MARPTKFTDQKDTLSALTPDDRNVNRGTPRGSAVIEKSLQKYGAGRSILVDRAGRIIAGNKTAEAASAIGMDNVRIVETDGHELVVVKRVDLDLDSAAARELAIADNRAGELNLCWDSAALRELAEEGVNLEGLFDPEELKALSEQVAVAPDEFPEYDEDIETEHSCPKCGFKWSGKSS